MPHRVIPAQTLDEYIKECRIVLAQKLDEYIKTHKNYHAKGMLCPHEGDLIAHSKMDEIMEDVQQAHDMLHAALFLAGHDPHAAHARPHAEAIPPHADIRKM